MREAAPTDALAYAVAIVICLILAVAWGTVGEVVYAAVNAGLAVVIAAFVYAHVLR